MEYMKYACEVHEAKGNFGIYPYVGVLYFIVVRVCAIFFNCFFFLLFLFRIYFVFFSGLPLLAVFHPLLRLHFFHYFLFFVTFCCSFCNSQFYSSLAIITYTYAFKWTLFARKNAHNGLGWWRMILDLFFFLPNFFEIFCFVVIHSCRYLLSAGVSHLKPHTFNDDDQMHACYASLFRSSLFFDAITLFSHWIFRSRLKLYYFFFRFIFSFSSNTPKSYTMGLSRNHRNDHNSECFRHCCYLSRIFCNSLFTPQHLQTTSILFNYILLFRI